MRAFFWVTRKKLQEKITMLIWFRINTNLHSSLEQE